MCLLEKWYGILAQLQDKIRVFHVIPETVWAKDSSNSGGLLYIFSSSSSNIRRSSSHLHIYTDHLHVFTTSHLHIFTNLLSFLSSSHLLIFTSSHLISCPLLLPLFLSLSPPSLSLSALLPSATVSFFFFSLFRPRAVPTRRHEMAPFSHEMRFKCQKLRYKIVILALRRQHFRTKWGSSVKNWGKIANLALRRQPFPLRRQPFRTKWGSIIKNWGKIAMKRPQQPFRTKSGSSVKSWGWFFGKFGWSGGNLFARNEVLVSKTEVKLRVSHFRGNPFARNEVRVAKTDVFLQFIILGGNIFARNELWVSKTDVFVKIWLVRRQPFRPKWCLSCKNWGFLASLVGPAATFSHEMMFECQKLRFFASLVGSGKGSACTSACM